MIRFIPIILIASSVFAQDPDNTPCTPIGGFDLAEELTPTPRGRVRRNTGEDSENKRLCQRESPCPPPLLSPVAPPPAPTLPLIAASTFVAPAPLPMDEDDYPDDDELSDSAGLEAQEDDDEFDPNNAFHIVTRIAQMWTQGEDNEHFYAVAETIDRIMRNPDQDPQEIIDEMNDGVNDFAQIVNHCVEMLRFLLQNPDRIDEFWDSENSSFGTLIVPIIDETALNNRSAAPAA